MVEIATIKLFKALSERLRLRILALLNHSPLSVGELVQILDQSQSTISHHIKTLSQLGLIEYEKKGNLNLYRIIKHPHLPEAFLATWQKKEQLFSELIEFKSDYSLLLRTLDEREAKGIPKDWQSWRKLQPDLPFTYELALRGIKKSGTAIDIGCGDGNFMQVISSTFEHLIGIDLSTKQLHTAAKRKQGHLLQADAMFLPISDNVVESVFYRMVLQFLPQPNLSLAEGIRVLKTGGRISIIDKIENDQDQNHQVFNVEYFQSICSKSANMRVLHFEVHPHVLLCVLEKV